MSINADIFSSGEGGSFTAGPGIAISGSNVISSTGIAPVVPSIVSIEDDFLSGFADFNYLGQENLVGDASVSAVNNGSDPNHPGIVTMISGTFVMTGGVIYSQTQTGNNIEGPYVLGGGTFEVNFFVKIPILSNGTNRFTVAFGLTDWDATFLNPITTTPANGCYFTYTDNVNGGQWQAFTYSASTGTTMNSTIAADTGWHRYTISINAAGSSVGFFIDGVQITGSPAVTNIPSTPIGVTILNNSGAGAGGNLYLDLYTVLYTLTAPIRTLT